MSRFYIDLEVAVPGNFSLEFNPGIQNCNPGTVNVNFRRIFVKIAQSLSIIAKIILFLSMSITFF
jgi:hypothetical protein